MVMYFEDEHKKGQNRAQKRLVLLTLLKTGCYKITIMLQPLTPLTRNKNFCLLLLSKAKV